MPYQDQKGFTLVELAIVLMIIGLLIGGVLKGQELISNARVTSSIRTIHDYQAAVVTFQDMYHVIPGDLGDGGTRLAGCTTIPCTSPNNPGDGQINDSTNQVGFWQQLGAANLISGINQTLQSFETVAPTFPIGGRVMAAGNITALTYFSGNRFIIGRRQGLTMRPALYPKQVAQIDRKMDNGLPKSGNVSVQSGADAWNADGADTCQTGTAYNETLDDVLCTIEVAM